MKKLYDETKIKYENIINIDDIVVDSKKSKEKRVKDYIDKLEKESLVKDDETGIVAKLVFNEKTEIFEDELIRMCVI